MERRREGRRERHLVAGKKTTTKKTPGKERSGGLIACAFLRTGEEFCQLLRDRELESEIIGEYFFPKKNKNEEERWKTLGDDKEQDLQGVALFTVREKDWLELVLLLGSIRSRDVA